MSIEPGDVVTSTTDRLALPMTVEKVVGEVANCVFFNARGEVHRLDFPVSALEATTYRLSKAAVSA